MISILKKINLQTLFPYMILGVFLVYMNGQMNTQQEDMVRFYNAVQDTTAHRIDKWGREVSETSQIRNSDPKVFVTLKSDDPAIAKLQEEVKKISSKLKDGSSVTNFSDNTYIDVKTNKGQYQDEWVTINNIGVDRTIVGVKNSYSVSLVEDKGEYLVNVINENPYSKGADSIKTFVKTPKPEKKWSVGVGMGYDPISGTIKPVIGVQYKLINLF